jgi:demethylmenaquinone methyltransferase/2-methoxy-6-polyprenyl-1,4-benzoquinol methylase
MSVEGKISGKGSNYEELVRSSEKTATVRKMFSDIAPRYDFMNRVLSLGRDLYWRRVAVRDADFDRNDIILDLGAGTGDVAREIIRNDRYQKIYGMDICEDLILHGRRKREFQNKNGTLLWIIGDGRYLPFENDSLDGIIAAFSIRNMANLPGVFSEIRRTLKTGGKLRILDMVQPGNGLFRWIFRLHFRYIVPVLGRLMGSEPGAYEYLLPSIENFNSAESLKTTFIDMGFKEVRVRKFMLNTVALLECEK